MVAFEDDGGIRYAWILMKVCFIYNVKYFDIEKENKLKKDKMINNL